MTIQTDNIRIAPHTAPTMEVWEVNLLKRMPSTSPKEENKQKQTKTNKK